MTGEDANPNLITAEKYQELVDAHVMFKDMAADPYLEAAGIASDWPCGRGCYQSADGGFIIWFGEEDQLRIMCMGKGFVLNSVFDRLRAALTKVESIDGIEFATSTKYGYVTSCPSNLGTGMRASGAPQDPEPHRRRHGRPGEGGGGPLGLSVRGTGGEHADRCGRHRGHFAIEPPLHHRGRDHHQALRRHQAAPREGGRRWAAAAARRAARCGA